MWRIIEGKMHRWDAELNQWVVDALPPEWLLDDEFSEDVAQIIEEDTDD